MLSTILPKHTTTDLLQIALENEVLDLYFVGHNARNTIYGFPKTDKVFQFILSQEGVISGKLLSRMTDIPGYEETAGDLSNIYIRSETFDVDIKAVPIDRYLLRSAFAGDGVAVHVPSGRLLVLPEYLTVPPTEQIRERKAFGIPENPMLEDSTSALAWKINHRTKLESFEKAVTNMANNATV